MKKTVAIIGAGGDTGSAIALGLAAAGYCVLLTDDIQNHPLRYLRLPLLECWIKCKVPQADVQMAVSRREASWEADIIIPAVRSEELAEVVSRIRDVVTGKVIISLAVPMNETHSGLVTVPATSAAEELAQLLPHSKIVKVVSTIFAAQPEKQNFGGMNDDVFVSGEDKGSVATVVQLLEDAGIHSVVIGALARSLTSGKVTAQGEQHAIHY